MSKSLSTYVRTGYYAHCVDIYHTPQEQHDLDALTRLGFRVVNPNSERTPAATKPTSWPTRA